MEFKKFNNKYVVRLDKGEEIVETLKNFCKNNNIRLGSITGVGATNRTVIGLFETKTKKYISKEFKGDYEIASLIGNITTMNNEVYLHLHISLGDRNQSSFSGHLNSAIVSATFEAIIDAIDDNIDRKFSEEIGLNLLKF